MSRIYKKTEKELVKGEPAWKKQRKLSLWKMYQSGKITRSVYEQKVQEVEKAVSWFPIKK